MDFRNSSQNRKAVKIKRDSRSSAKLNIKSLPTLFSRKKMKKVGKKSNKVEKMFSKARVRIGKQSKVSEIAATTQNPRYLIYTSRCFFWKSRKRVEN